MPKVTPAPVKKPSAKSLNAAITKVAAAAETAQGKLLETVAVTFSEGAEVSVDTGALKPRLGTVSGTIGLNVTVVDLKGKTFSEKFSKVTLV